MKKYILPVVLLLVCVISHGQDLQSQAVGRVSFVSSQNIYARFTSTEGISAGDTLFITSGGKTIPALVVKSLSSMSCLCEQITTEPIPVDHIVIANVKKAVKSDREKISTTVVDTTIFKPKTDSIPGTTKSLARRQSIHGSLTINSYSDLAGVTSGKSQSYRTIFSLDASHIANSRLSAETYLSFGSKAGEWSLVKNNVFSALKIYSLALKYDIGESMTVSIGRKMNPRLANIGAIDGLQYEAASGKFRFGAVAGFRPDYSDYGFNANLFQAGGYASYSTKKDSHYTESSVAFMQQMNGSKTDRRFIYLQHSNSLTKNIYIFSTFEIDLYKLENDKPKTTFDLTGLYFLARYRVSNRLSFSGSYDARKNVMYYETFKTYLDRLLESEMRQGFRFQSNYRITDSFIAGINAGYRFVKSDPHPSKNVYGYLTYSNNKVSYFSATISGTWLQSNYMNGYIGGITLSKGLFGSKLFTDLSYRFVNNRLPESSSTVIQNIVELNLSLQLFRNLYLSTYYEGTFEKSDHYNRIFLQTRIRF